MAASLVGLGMLIGSPCLRAEEAMPRLTASSAWQHDAASSIQDTQAGSPENEPTTTAAPYEKGSDTPQAAASDKAPFIRRAPTTNPENVWIPDPPPPIPKQWENNLNPPQPARLRSATPVATIHLPGQPAHARFIVDGATLEDNTGPVARAQAPDSPGLARGTSSEQRERPETASPPSHAMPVDQGSTPVAPTAPVPVVSPAPLSSAPLAATERAEALAQVQPSRNAPAEDILENPQVTLQPPGQEEVFRRESEAALHERMRQQARNRATLDRIDFPPEPVLSTESYAGRNFPPSAERVEPKNVCYGRLYFEELNSERYGWDLGFIQPFVSAGVFFFDVAALPYHAGTDICRHYECDAGYCLPGDPVPYLIYPPQLSVTGTLLEAGTVVSLFAIFPG